MFRLVPVQDWNASSTTGISNMWLMAQLSATPMRQTHIGGLLGLLEGSSGTQFGQTRRPRVALVCRVSTVEKICMDGSTVRTNSCPKVLANATSKIGGQKRHCLCTSTGHTKFRLRRYSGRHDTRPAPCWVRSFQCFSRALLLELVSSPCDEVGFGETTWKPLVQRTNGRDVASARHCVAF